MGIQRYRVELRRTFDTGLCFREEVVLVREDVIATDAHEAIIVVQELEDRRSMGPQFYWSARPEGRA